MIAKEISKNYIGKAGIGLRPIKNNIMKRQTIIITGASSGIGKEIARYFLEKGDNVVINSYSAEKLEQAYRELDGGANLATVAGDVSDKKTGENLLAVALEKFGSADVLVNNAGIFESRPFLEVDEDYLDRFLDTNLKGTFFTSQAIIPQMLKQNDGVVINIGTPKATHATGSSYASAAQNLTKMKDNRQDSLAITQALEKYYFKGIYEGNIESLANIFNPGTLLFGDINGQPYAKTLNQYLDGVKNRQSPKDSGKPFKGTIISVDVINSIAIAKVHVKMYEFNYDEFLSFHKIDNSWVIVNKMITNVPE